MDEVYASVQERRDARPPGREADVFPPMVGHMVSVGEESGQLEQMLTKIADFYEAEVDAKVKALTSLLEPAMIVFVGAMVGFIVIAMYLPLFSLYDKIPGAGHQAAEPARRAGRVRCPASPSDRGRTGPGRQVRRSP